MPALGQRQEKCKRGHNDWYIKGNGKRQCRICELDRQWYRRRGIKLV